MAQFTSDGLSLAYDEFGPKDARKAVVLVHGFSANRYENWKRMGWYDAIAAKGMRGLALDNRGQSIGYRRPQILRKKLSHAWFTSYRPAVFWGRAVQFLSADAPTP